MHLLMLRLRAMRERRGSLDFDLPEPDVRLDATGRPEQILRRERNDAHRIIEEFMIAANEAVADWFAEHRRPAIHRVHAPPDVVKLRAFVEFAKAYGHFPEFGGLATSRAIGAFLASIRGAPAERALNHILLRTMMRAQYAEENTGHYGLASERYLHFTSPIRRYPDLVDHRLTKALLRREPSPEDRAGLRRIAAQSTEREQKASACEFEVLDVIRADFMKDRLGEEFEGIIEGVIEEGFFVELLDVYVEGFVRVQDLADDWYRFDPESRTLRGRKTKRRFAIGDPIRVRIQAVHVAVGRIELALVRGGLRRRGGEA
jgi:ribonuclease R